MGNRKKNKVLTAYLVVFLQMTIAVISIISVISMMPSVTAQAAGDLARLVDWADLLSDDEEAELSDRLDEISERQQVDVIVVTVDSLEGASAMEYADDFYDYNGYGFGTGHDGVLFLMSMGEREWHISTRGYGITAFTDAGLDYMSEDFLPYLKDGDYAGAFNKFAEQCDDYITQAKTGSPYDVDNVPMGQFSPVGALLIAIGIGFVISLVVTGFVRLGLHSVYSRSEADSYMKQGSLRLTREHELFLYRTVTKTEKPKESSSSGSSSGGSTTHTSSSGSTHGGKGGKF